MYNLATTSAVGRTPELVPPYTMHSSRGKLMLSFNYFLVYLYYFFDRFRTSMKPSKFEG